MELMIVSGLSGSGKSIALQTLEDLDFYCVDNLPMDLLPAFAESMNAAEGFLTQRIAIGIDARNSRENLDNFESIVTQLRSTPLAVQVLFLRCADDVLVQRYSETRRRHPLSRGDIPLADAIRRERQLMTPVAEIADLIIDTGQTNVHELRQLIKGHVQTTTDESISLLLTSFGYKHGIPSDADFVFDVRCLPNPYWVPRLRASTGRDEDVGEYLEQHEQVSNMVGDVRSFLSRWIPQFETGTRSYMNIAVGCTGGLHRSVYVVETLANHFGEQGRRVSTRHRELR